ncbi:MAG: flagellar basal body rod protein FlgB [Bacillota bacterium]
MNFSGSGIFGILARALDAGALRQRVIADNIANSNTPGFKRSGVRFEDKLARALGEGKLPLLTGHPRHIGGADPAAVEPEVVTERHTAMRADGNNVDMEREMVELVMGNLGYRTAAQVLAAKFDGLRYVINGGR